MREPPLKILPPAKGQNGILPWVIAVMVYLSALAIAGGFGLRTAAHSWTADVAHRLSVQIIADEESERDRRTAKALAVLQDIPGVAKVQSLSKQQINALLEPWLGTGNVSDDLPVPAIIDIVLTNDGNNNTQSSVIIAEIQEKLKTNVPGAELDTHQQWLGELTQLTNSISWTANFIVVLVTLATMAIVAFSTRSGLAAHQPTIDILHLIGAPDRLVAREFQRRMGWLGLLGGIIGILFAAATIGLLGWFARRAGEGLLASVNLSPVLLLVLACLPLFAGLLTLITARLTVLRVLNEQL